MRWVKGYNFLAYFHIFYNLLTEIAPDWGDNPEDPLYINHDITSLYLIM